MQGYVYPTNSMPKYAFGEFKDTTLYKKSINVIIWVEYLNY